jgi:hypothetical protein
MIPTRLTYVFTLISINEFTGLPRQPAMEVQNETLTYYMYMLSLSTNLFYLNCSLLSYLPALVEGNEKSPTSFFSPAAGEKSSKPRKARPSSDNSFYIKQQNTDQ